jgi:hypothetical protein
LHPWRATKVLLDTGRVSPTLQSEKNNSDVQRNSNCVDHERAKFIWPARSVFSVFETKFQQRNEA